MYKLLVADDNQIGREAIAYIIRTNDLPFEVSQAKNGQEALQMIRTTRYDCVITDIRMPRLSGIELVRIVSEEERHVPVFVICSGYQEFEDAKTAMEYGVRNYLVKPIDVSKLLKTMHDIVDDLRLREAYRLRDMDGELAGCLSGSKKPENGEIRQILEKTNRVVLIYNEQERSREAMLQLRERIGGLSDGQAMYVHMDVHWDAVLFSAPDEDRRQLRDFVLELKLIYKQQERGQLFMGVSRHIEGLNTLAEDVQEAMRCCSRKLFLGQPKIIYADESGDDTQEQLQAWETRIRELIDSGSYAEVREELLHYLDQVSQMQNVSTAYIRYQVSNYIQALLHHSGMEAKVSFYHFVEEVGSCKSVPHLKRTVLELLDEFLSENAMSSQETDAVEQAERIIREKYGTDLTLESIAQQVYLSPYYLSRAFKQKTGVNLFTYLTNVRMENGKRLLQESNLRVAEISRRVGYDNPSYFGQVFKQYYGVTPKRFRAGNGQKEQT